MTLRVPIIRRCTDFECIFSHAVKALLLNVDVVTQFDPYLEESYKGMIEECEACTARMQRRREDKSLQPDTQAPAQTTDNSMKS